jgi:hypothetical protein
MGSDIFN